MNEDEEIDMEMLTEKILDFLKLKLQWIASARHIWLIDAESGDVVMTLLEFHDRRIVEELLEVPRDIVEMSLKFHEEDYGAKIR